jgi:hypothetical protein
MKFFKLYKKSFINFSWLLPLLAVGIAIIAWVACYLNGTPIKIVWCALIGIAFSLVYPALRIDDSK